MMKTQNEYITIKVLESQKKTYDKKIPSGSYTGFPDFVRDAIREKLEASK